MPIAPIVVPIVTSAISALSRLFGGGGPPYMARLTQQAVPLAQQSGLPVLAYVDDKLIAFLPTGSVQEMGSGANAQTAGILMENALNALGAAILIDKIEPLQFHEVGGGSYENQVAGEEVTQAGLGNLGAGLTGSNTLYLVGGAVLLFLILRKRI